MKGSEKLKYIKQSLQKVNRSEQSQDTLRNRNLIVSVEESSPES